MSSRAPLQAAATDEAEQSQYQHDDQDDPENAHHASFVYLRFSITALRREEMRLLIGREDGRDGAPERPASEHPDEHRRSPRPEERKPASAGGSSDGR